MINRLLKCTLVVLIITVSQAYSAPPDSTSVGMTIYNDVKEGAGTVYNDVKEALGQFAAALKVGVEHVYGVLVMQQVVTATTWTIILLIGAIGMYISHRTGSNLKYVINESRYNTTKELESGQDFKLVFICIFGITSLFTFGIGLAHLKDIATGFINPEYGAIQEILNSIGR